MTENSPAAVFEPAASPAVSGLASRPAAATVFQVGTGWFPERKGGAESIFHNLCLNLGDQGFEVTGVVPGTERVEADTAGQLRSFPADGHSMPGRARAARRATKESFAARRPDLVASHFALYTAPLLDLLRTVPMVVHFHGPWALESQVEGAGKASVAAKRMVERLVYRRARLVVVLSDAFAELVQKEYGVDGSRVRRVPGGIDCAQFDPAESRRDAREVLGWDPGRPTVFTARRLVRRMGLDKLVAAMASVRRQPAGRDAVLHVAGSGPARPELERQIAELGLAGSVHLDGFVPDEHLALAYRAADLTLVPTGALEGFGLVAAESLAAGTPVLVTPVGGLPEVVAGLSRNCVLPGTDAASIADGLMQFLRDPSWLPGRRACQAFARQRYDWGVVTKQVADVYREALSWTTT